MSNRIITISREFGSGGRTIGREVAVKLGLPCYDAELIEKLEEATGLSRDYIAERGEYAAHGSWLSSAFSDRDLNGHSVQDDLWCVQRQVILELAGNGPCVIMGRCADYILQDTADCLYLLGYGKEDPADCGTVRSAGRFNREAPPGQGQTPRCLLSILHRHEMGPYPELSYCAQQRSAGD